MERITRPFKVQKIPKEQLDNLDIPWPNINEPEPKQKSKDIEWENDTTVFKRGRIKVLRNKRQTKYSVEGLTKTEFNKLRDVL